MNSQEEAELFTSYGWTYDVIARQWVSPSGNQIVSNDMLVKYNESRETEEQLKQHIARFGSLKHS